MRVARMLSAVLAGAALAVGAGGCFLVANLDAYGPDDAGDAGDAGDGGPGEGGVDNPNLPSSLSLTLLDFGYHYNQLIEFRIIDDQNRMQSRGFIEPLDKAGTVKLTVNVPNAIPTENRPYRLDFYGDMDDSGTYDGIGNILTQDHAWRISPLTDYPASEITHVANLIQVVFEHNKYFTDIDQWPLGHHNPAVDTGLAARVRFNGASLVPYKGKLCEIRIAEAQGGHVVGLYRNPEIPKGDFAAYLPGVLDPGVDYYVEIYVDANGDGEYQNPAKPSANSDFGWRIPIRAGDGSTSDGGDAGEPLGIDYSFDLDTEPNPNNVDVGPP